MIAFDFPDGSGDRPVQARPDRRRAVVEGEAHASGSDVRLICDLFGLSIAGAYRYTATVDHLGIAEYEHARPR